MRKNKLSLTIFLLLLGGFFTFVHGQYITSNWIPWNAAVPPIRNEAGIDYDYTEIESPNNQLLLNAGQFIWWWKVSVHLSFTNLPEGLTISACRTGNGVNSLFTAFITGHLNDYKEITTTPQGYFFYGYDRYRNIPIKYKISGISVLRPTGTYQATVTYTITSGNP